MDQLNVVDVKTGIVRKTGKPTRFDQFAVSSTLTIGPPFVWLNAKEILFVQTKGSTKWDAKQKHLYLEGDQTNHLAVLNIKTGTTRDIAALPGNPSLTRMEMEMPPIVAY